MMLVSILVKPEMKEFDPALRRAIILILKKAELDGKLGYPFICPVNGEAYPVTIERLCGQVPSLNQSLCR